MTPPPVAQPLVHRRLPVGLAVLFAVLLPVTGASGQPAPDTTMTPGAQRPLPETPDSSRAEALAPAAFAQAAQAALLYGVASTDLALQAGQSEAVKAFARQMREDDLKAQAVLTRSAQEEGLSISSAMTTEDKEKMAALKTAASGDFDAAFLSAQISALTRSADIFAAYARDGKAGPLKRFAEGRYPTLRMHLLRAQSFSGGDR